MGCDMVVALPAATVDGHTLFGINVDRPLRSGRPLCRIAGKEFAPGEKLRAQYIELPQTRRTNTILGSQPEGWWGFTHGINEHGLAVGQAQLRSRLHCSEPGVTAGDLVRLVLERCHGANQAVDCLTSLLERHGQSPAPGDRPDTANATFLVADGSEAYCVETAGRYWACQQAGQVKAASNLCQIRQDWDRIAHGLAGKAIDEGWWAPDGRKLDFAGALGESPVGERSGLRAWGRATFLLEQQNGHIDVNFVRQLLSDHYEGTHFEIDPFSASAGPTPICHHARAQPNGGETAVSFVAEISGEHCAVAGWYAFGPPCATVYFPVCLEGDPPTSFAYGELNQNAARLWEGPAHLARVYLGDPEQRGRVQGAFERLQSRFDQETEEFAREAVVLRQRRDAVHLQHVASTFMQHCVEEFEHVAEELGIGSKTPPMPLHLIGRDR